MVKSNYVVINSKFRQKSGSLSTSDFSYSLGEALEIKGLSVKSVSIPNVAVNINQYFNSLTVITNGNTFVATVPVGQYTTTTLMAAVKLALDTVTVNIYTVTQDPFTQRITIASGVATQIIIGGLATKLGFHETELGGLSKTATGLPQLNGTSNYFVMCNQLVQGFNGIFKNGERRYLLADVNNTVPYGDIVHYEATDFRLNFKSYQAVQNIQFLNFQIVDDDLNVVDLQGLDVELVIKVFLEGAKELNM